MKTLEESAYSLKQVVEHVPEEVCARIDEARMKAVQLKVVRMEEQQKKHEIRELSPYSCWYHQRL